MSEPDVLACDAVIDCERLMATGNCRVIEERNESLQSDAHGVTLARMLSHWCATKDCRHLRRALLALLLDLEST